MSALVPFKNEADLKAVLAKEYRKQIDNFFGDDKKALEFLSNVVAAVQRNPKLLECRPDTLVNSFITMASLRLMPSGVSGEAFVLPYLNKGQMEAQFQLGYQGLVTLFYRAGIRSIVAEIVREKDVFDYVNGEVHHRPDVFAEDRGPAIGAYVIIETQQGGKLAKVMSKKDIVGIGQKFSKSFKSGFTPWNEENDPELWMWKKTVLKQCAKLVPKNETIYRAIEADNRDSIVSDRKEETAGSAVAAAIGSNLDDYRAGIKACTTIEELERVWADLPGDAKVALRASAEEVRAMIMSEGGDVQPV